MIPISAPSLTELERSYLLKAFDSGWVSSHGEFVGRAEGLLRDVAETAHAAVVSNGTTALHLALLAAGVRPGDEVIMPAVTYVATINAALYVGATPVLVDVADSDWCIEPAAVRRALSDRTSVVLAVDLYGQPANYLELRDVCADRNLALVADAAESIGATIDGRAAASYADIATFSFFGNKVVTSGEGGAVVSSNEEVDRLVRQLRNQGNNPHERYRHDLLGYNYRMTNTTAALLTGQLERLPELVGARRTVLRWYSDALSSDDRFVLQRTTPATQASPWMFSVRIRGASAMMRDEVISVMGELGVETRPVFPLLDELPYTSVRVPDATQTAAVIANEGISLPTHPGLTREQVTTVIDRLDQAVRRVVRAH